MADSEMYELPRYRVTYAVPVRDVDISEWPPETTSAETPDGMTYITAVMTYFAGVFTDTSGAEHLVENMLGNPNVVSLELVR